MTTNDLLEQSRLKLQGNLDATKPLKTRKRLGQFATPAELATEILQYARQIIPPKTSISFLDPAFGTGSFYSALLQVFPRPDIAKAVGFEIDPDYGQAARYLWDDKLLVVHIADYTRALPPKSGEERFNLIICNPPYVRHQELEIHEKERLREYVQKAVGIRLSGLAGLYCYFLLLSDSRMASGGLSGWLIPSEFMDVNYGAEVKEYLLTRVKLLRIHRFDPMSVQFADALVSSAVVWFEKKEPPSNHKVEFTYGGTLLQPAIAEHISLSTLRQTSKWTQFPVSPDLVEIPQRVLRLRDLFEVKRGLATGANEFFILTDQEAQKRQLPREFLKPVLPPPRCLHVDEINADSEGKPILDQKLFLLSTDLSENILRKDYPMLCRYLESGIEMRINERYLCKHRFPWYSQEKRPPAPLLCTYIGRVHTGTNRIFRFILNHSCATATNVYLMLYPKDKLERALANDPSLLKTIWKSLNSLPANTLIKEGRVYGGGLYKLEPSELGNVSVNHMNSPLQNMYPH